MSSTSTLPRHIGTLRGAGSEITAMRWVENGLFFLLRNGRAYIAPLQGQEAHPMLHVKSDYIAHAAWSSEGIFLAVTARGRVEIHDIISKQEVLTLPIRGIRMPSRVAWSRFDQWIAVAARGIRVFDTANGDEIGSFPSHVAGVTDVVWSPDASYLATADEWGFVRINNLQTGEVDELTRTKPRGYWGKIAWSPCGRFLMIDTQEGMDVFDLKQDRTVAKIEHRGIRFCAFQTWGIHPPPEEQALFLTKSGADLRIWRTRDWSLVATIDIEGSNYIFTEAAFHPFESVIAVPSENDRALHYWQIPLGGLDQPVKEELKPDPLAPVTLISQEPQSQEQDANAPELKTLADAVESAATADEKGKSLEVFIEALLKTIPDWDVAERHRNNSEEFDRTISNRCREKPFSEWGEVILVECKNTKKKTGAPDASSLLAKMNTRRGRCRTAFLISWNGFSRAVRDVLLSTRPTENLVVTITGDELKKAILDGNFPDWLSRKYWAAMMD